MIIEVILIIELDKMVFHHQPLVKRSYKMQANPIALLHIGKVKGGVIMLGSSMAFFLNLRYNNEFEEGYNERME